MATPSTITPSSHVGFDSITSQIERKLLKRGFQFNVICVGKWRALLRRLGADQPMSRLETNWIDRPDWLGQVDAH